MEPKKYRAISKMSIEEMNDAGIAHVNGWVEGWYADGYLIGDVVEVDEDYINFNYWCPIHKETLLEV